MNKTISGLALTAAFILGGQPYAQTSSRALIELFTSQGCSSCPPAEELLNSWGMDLFKAKKALPLAFHVDYWDYLGWKDPFSSSFATQRQQQYSSFYNSTTIYTPEMVVNGRPGFNGADLAQAQSEVAQASSLSEVKPLTLKAEVRPQKIRIHISLPPKDQLQKAGNPVVYVVIFENDLGTKIDRGENSGAFLNQNFVVRYQAAAPENRWNDGWNPTIDIDPGWRLSHLGVSAWIQSPQTMKIGGLNWVYPVSGRQPSSN